MGRRGIPLSFPRRMPSGKPEAGAVTVARPERYMETLFQSLSCGVRTALLTAPWHFEARKFLLDLKRLIEVSLEGHRGA